MPVARELLRLFLLSLAFGCPIAVGILAGFTAEFLRLLDERSGARARELL